MGCLQTQPKIKYVRQPQGKKAPERLDVSKMNQDNMRQAFINDICNHLDAVIKRTQKRTTAYQNEIHSASLSALGHPFCKHIKLKKVNNEQ